VVEVVVQFVKEYKVNNCQHSVVDYLTNMDYYKVLMMQELMDKVIVMTVDLLDKVWID
jgi:hypothetical protein